jgi:hypothetical protein
MDSHTRTARKVRLEVEALEERVTPDATTYVTGLYNDVLQRSPDSAGLSFWASQLQSGAQSRQQIASAFWLSPEHRSLQVQQYYQQYLHRSADPTGLTFWTQVFNGGQSEIQVQERIIASQEFQNANASDTAYITALYQDILGRAPEAAGLAFWQSQLQTGSSENNRSPRQNVALGILTSDEARLIVINHYYNTLLHRGPDPAGQQFWLGQLRSNENPELLTGQSSGNNENNNQADVLTNFVAHHNDSGAASQESVAVNFLTSQEYIATH